MTLWTRPADIAAAIEAGTVTLAWERTDSRGATFSLLTTPDGQQWSLWRQGTDMASMIAMGPQIA